MMGIRTVLVEHFLELIRLDCIGRGGVFLGAFSGRGEGREWSAR